MNDPAANADRRLLLVGMGLVVAGALLAWAVLGTPILSVAGPSPGEVGWIDLWERGGVPYEVVLLLLPVLGAAMMAGGGALLVGLALARSKDVTLRVAALVCAATGAVLGVLSTTRWLGFVLARALDTGASSIQPGIAAWLGVPLGVLGILSIVWVAPRGRAVARDPLFLAPALAVLLAPLLPYAIVRGAGRAFFLDELTLGGLAAVPDSPLRGLAWAAISGSAIMSVQAIDSLARAARPDVGRNPVRRWASLGLAVAGIALAAWFYGELVRIHTDADPGWNHLLILTEALVAFLLVRGHAPWTNGPGRAGSSTYKAPEGAEVDTP